MKFATALLLLIPFPAHPQGGGNWTAHRSPHAVDMLAAAWDGKQFAAVASGALFTTSSDGTAWEGRNIAAGALRSVAWIGGRYYVGGDNGLLMSSATGVSWITHPTGTPSAITAIAGGGGRFLALGFPNTLLSSRDGLEWTAKTADTRHVYHDIIWTDGRFFLAGEAGLIRASVDGETWVDEASGTTEDLYGFARADTALLAVGIRGQAVVRSLPVSDAVFRAAPRAAAARPVLAWSGRTGRMEFLPGVSATGARDARGRFLFIQGRENP